MSKTTRTLMAVPLAAAALAVGAAPAMADPVKLPNLDIAQPETQPEPHPQPGPQLPGDKIVPANDPGPQDGPDDKDGPNDGPGPQDGPDDKGGPNPDNDDSDNDDGDNDDSDNDDGDNDDSDNDDGDNDDSDNDDGDNDDSDNDVKRPTRVDAGDGGTSMSLAWVLAGGAVVSAAGAFAARKRLS